MLYRKVRRRYVAVGREFDGWPAPGVWLVEETPGRKSSQVIAKLGEVPDPVEFVAFARHTEAIAVAVLEQWRLFKDGLPMSAQRIAEAIVRAVYAKVRGS